MEMSVIWCREMFEDLIALVTDRPFLACACALMYFIRCIRGQARRQALRMCILLRYSRLCMSAQVPRPIRCQLTRSPLHMWRPGTLPYMKPLIDAILLLFMKLPSAMRFLVASGLVECSMLSFNSQLSFSSIRVKSKGYSRSTFRLLSVFSTKTPGLQISSGPKMNKSIKFIEISVLTSLTW